MESTGTLLLERKDVIALLGIEECMAEIESVFCAYAQGKIQAPKVLGLPTDNGGFHIKAGLAGDDKPYFVTKINGNFPGNPTDNGLPAIQGIIAVFHAMNGRLLALMDSIEITVVRTGAATAIAAKYLALPEATVATICGCGNQGKISLKTLRKVRKIEKVFAFDIDENQREKFAQEFARDFEMIPVAGHELSGALLKSQIVVTCTPSKEAFIQPDDISPGTFIAAVGADSEEKQELAAELLARNKVVVDLAAQSVVMGELHHAITRGLMSVEGIHADLGEIIAGKKHGRQSHDEIIIFDSTGTALQDIAAASIVYEKALIGSVGLMINLSGLETPAQ